MTLGTDTSRSHAPLSTQESGVEFWTLVKRADWCRIGPRLTFHALISARELGWAGAGTGTELHGGWTARDVAQEAMVVLLKRGPDWECGDDFNLVAYLKGMVYRMLLQLRRSRGRHKEVPIPNGEGTSAWIEAMPRDESLEADPERQWLEQLRKRTVLDQVERLRERIDGDAELLRLVDTMLLMEETRPRHLAKELGVPVEQIYIRIKRLRRKARRKPGRADSRQHKTKGDRS
ncbi:MAG: hypothetical protein CME06_16810 [Gemmatimonadetes bacterium]|nr:hypothetical protein [Gemmatimonadota bacterium]